MCMCICVENTFTFNEPDALCEEIASEVSHRLVNSLIYDLGYFVAAYPFHYLASLGNKIYMN